jgi:O-antigen ligase
VVFASLQLAALAVLVQRRVSLSRIISRNLWVALFLGYCALSIAWSEFPLVAFKRWLKVLGHPLMVMIVVTEPDPGEALVRLMKRAAYVLVPFSILLIKYYPELGRGFDPWTGQGVNTGITTNKNLLGSDCLVLGFFFFWHFLTALRRKRGRERRNDLLLDAAFLGMIGWLVWMANSATSLVALIVGIATVLFLGLRFINKRYIGSYLVTALVVVSAVWFAFGMTDTLIKTVGRDPTLTGRVELWQDVLTFDINPVFGAGFESFWLGKRVEILWAKHWWRPNQAHNGYLETYLNLGWVGVILLAGWIMSAFWKARRTLLSDFDFGRFRLGLVAMVVVYNYTEATFKALHLVWFVFYIVAMDYSRAGTLSLKNQARDVDVARRGQEAASTRRSTGADRIVRGRHQSTGGRTPKTETIA